MGMVRNRGRTAPAAKCPRRPSGIPPGPWRVIDHYWAPFLARHRAERKRRVRRPGV